MSTLHFVFGKPGAGKTTLARGLAEEMSAIAFIEDDWLSRLYADPVTELAQYVDRARRVRSVLGPLVIELLSRGTSVVLDFAGNTVRDRAWVRALFEAAGADHVLHVLDLPDAECRRRVHARNVARPPGLYFGAVSDAVFDAVLPHIAAPVPEESFAIIRHAWEPAAEKTGRRVDRARFVRRLGTHSPGDPMRFMMIVKPPAHLGEPDPAQFEAMGRFNDELLRAGVLLDLNGLAPSAQGARVRFDGPTRTVTDGPFVEAKELIAGYWIIQVRSQDEAIEWAKRIPFSTEVHPGEQVEVEIRQIVEIEDLPVSPDRVAKKKALEQR